MDIVEVRWRIGSADYVMVRVRPYELERVKKAYPDMLGIPQQWAQYVDGDVDWWPKCREGELVVILAR